MTARLPDDGFWLCIARIHHASQLYTECRTDLIETIPRRWNIESASAGTSARTQFVVENRGQALENLSYAEVIENTTLQEFEGHVGYKETWNKTVNVTERTKKISAEFSPVGGSNEVRDCSCLREPEGVGKEENADLGSGDIRSMEINNPELGNWTLKVYGYNVPKRESPLKSASRNMQRSSGPGSRPKVRSE